jgi:hypothetical protein
MTSYTRLDDELRQLAAPPSQHRNDTRWRTFGVVLLVAGVAIAVAGYWISATTSDALRQRDGLALGPIGITVTIAGAAVFLRYSLSGFLRFWLARLVATQQTTAPPGPPDRVRNPPADAVRTPPGGPTPDEGVDRCS